MRGNRQAFAFVFAFATVIVLFGTLPAGWGFTQPTRATCPSQLLSGRRSPWDPSIAPWVVPGRGEEGGGGRPAAARFLRRSRRGRRIRSQRRVLPRREAHPPPDLPAPPPRVLGGQALGAPLPSCRCDVAAHQPGGGRGWGQERVFRTLIPTGSGGMLTSR